MEDYEDLWFDYSIQFHSKLVERGEDWSQLDEVEQEIAALWKLCVDMSEGGLLEFFCNWGYDCFCYALRGLKRIGDDTLYTLLKDTYHAVLEHFKEDDRLTEYWDILKYLTEEEEAQLEATTTQFDETECEKLTRLAYEYYHQTLQKTVG